MYILDMYICAFVLILNKFTQKGREQSFEII